MKFIQILKSIFSPLVYNSCLETSYRSQGHISWRVGAIFPGINSRVDSSRHLSTLHPRVQRCPNVPNVFWFLEIFGINTKFVDRFFFFICFCTFWLVFNFYINLFIIFQLFDPFPHVFRMFFACFSHVFRMFFVCFSRLLVE